MAKPRVFLSRAWPAKVEARMAEVFDLTPNKSDRPLTPAEFREAFASFDAVLPTVTDKLTESAFDLAKPRTRILANYGVGYSHINTAEAARHKIVVTNTPDVLSDCTADLAMTLLLMVARRAGEGERELREGRWTGWRPTRARRAPRACRSRPRAPWRWIAATSRSAPHSGWTATTRWPPPRRCAG